MERQLTRAEEEIMQQLWQMGPSFLRPLVDSFGPEGPHQNTVATILKTLHNKGFVSIESVGRNHLYKPAVSKEQYGRQTATKLVQRYFKGSFGQMVSFFANDKSISVHELEEILQQLKKQQP
ncbi:MAG: BlaI/MecI/CopY family transcriptional regulator [Chitinophagaceae bacterium]|jgi:predicted transcriptional regulator|nr:BlaI/MecI/CopY family transcriptional regulator [Chitinophagaceae bacterium]